MVYRWTVDLLHPRHPEHRPDEHLASTANGGAAPEALTDRGIVTSLAPLDPRTVLYTARDPMGAGPWLWALDTETRTSHRVSLGLEQYTSIAASADGRRLVASVARPRAELLTVPIMSRLTTVDDVRPYGVPGVRALAPRIRGQALFYLSGQGTGDGLWRLQDDQATEIWRGSRGALLEAASISPDGLQVAVVLRQGGKRTLTLERVDGSQPRAIGESIDVAGTSDWSPDGQWVVVGGDDGQGQGPVQDFRGRRRTGPPDDRAGIRPGVVPGRRPHRLRRRERGRSGPAAGGSTRWNACGTAASANGRLHHHWTAPISAAEWPWCRVPERRTCGVNRTSGCWI